MAFISNARQFRKVADQLEKTGFLNYIDVTVKTREGKEIPADVYLTDRAKVIQCNIRDISERKHISDKLSANEKRYHELFNHISSGVAVYEAVENGNDFVFKDFNAAAEKIEQTPREKVIGRKVTDVFPGIRDMNLLGTFKRVWKTGKPEHHPVSIYKDEHLMGWRENYVYKLPSGEIVAVYEDLTEHKRIEEELRMSEERHRAISLLMPDHIIVHDRQLKYTFVVNPQLGLTEQEMLGKTDYDFMPKDEAEKLTRAKNRS